MNPKIFTDITIEYKTVDSGDWQRVRLAPTDYFELDADGDVADDSIELHDHAIDYLDLDPRSVQITRLTVSDATREIGHTIVETFWNDGQSRIIERTDTGPEPDYQLIVDARIATSPPTWDMLRFTREDGVLKLRHHGVIRDNEDGSQSEDIF